MSAPCCWWCWCRSSGSAGRCGCCWSPGVVAAAYTPAGRLGRAMASRAAVPSRLSAADRLVGQCDAAPLPAGVLPVSGRFGWLTPAGCRLAEQGLVLGLVTAAAGRQLLPGAYAVLAVAAFRAYDVTYRQRLAGATVTRDRCAARAGRCGSCCWRSSWPRSWSARWAPEPPTCCWGSSRRCGSPRRCGSAPVVGAPRPVAPVTAAEPAVTGPPGHQPLPMRRPPKMPPRPFRRRATACGRRPCVRSGPGGRPASSSPGPPGRCSPASPSPRPRRV